MRWYTSNKLQTVWFFFIQNSIQHTRIINLLTTHCSLSYQHSFSNFLTWIKYQYDIMLYMLSIQLSTIYVLVAPKFYSNGRPIFVIATSFALFDSLLFSVLYIKCINKRVKSIIFAVFIKFCDEWGLAIKKNYTIS